MQQLICSHCNRAAVWLIRDAPFCEAHKERVIEDWGVDRFPVKRLEADDHRFLIRGRLKRPCRPCADPTPV